MKKIYYVICGKCRKFNNPKISCIFENKIVLLVTCSNWKLKNIDETRNYFV